MQTRRLGILESSLNGREKVLAWLKKSQARGGLYDHCRREDAPLLLENEKIAFLFHLVNQCNVQVLELTVSPGIRILGLYLLRLTLCDTIKVHDAELDSLRPILLNVAMQGLALRAAIQNVSREHMAGNEILFRDVQQELSDAIQKREHLVEAFNSLPPRLGFGPIGTADLEASVSEETLRKTDELIRLCSAQAAADFGCRHEALELLHPLIEPRLGVIG